jgi:aminocarboxymuconate-semialdehyde decarboxylase
MCAQSTDAKLLARSDSHRGISMKKIDMHGHIVFVETFNKAGEYGPAYVKEDGVWKFKVGPYTAEVPGNLDPADSMIKMNDPHWFRGELDRVGIDMLGITGSPLLYFYWTDLDLAVNFHRLQNDCMSKFCAVYPERFFWLPSLPLQNIEAAIAEVKRTIPMGAKGVNIGSDVSVRGLDDPAMWPFYQTLVDNNLSIFIHPYPKPMAKGEKEKYHLSWVTGYTSQETDAFATMVLGGVFDDFPSLRVYITHGGGFTPYQIGRIDGAWRVKNPGVRCKQSPYEYRKNFFFDILVHDPTARRFLVDSWGVDNLVIGSNYSGWNWMDEFKHIPALNLSIEDQEKISYKNAERLFNLKA